MSHEPTPSAEQLSEMWNEAFGRALAHRFSRGPRALRPQEVERARLGLSLEEWMAASADAEVKKLVLDLLAPLERLVQDRPDAPLYIAGALDALCLVVGEPPRSQALARHAYRYF